MGSSAPLYKLVLVDLNGCMAGGGGLIENRHVSLKIWFGIGAVETIGTVETGNRLFKANSNFAKVVFMVFISEATESIVPFM